MAEVHLTFSHIRPLKRGSVSLLSISHIIITLSFLYRRENEMTMANCYANMYNHAVEIIYWLCRYRKRISGWMRVCMYEYETYIDLNHNTSNMDCWIGKVCNEIVRPHTIKCDDSLFWCENSNVLCWPLFIRASASMYEYVCICHHRHHHYSENHYGCVKTTECSWARLVDHF